MLADNPGLKLLDMKEKFGGISVLPAGEAPPEVFQRVLDIFGISSHTCQRCGGEADQKSAGWLFTICDACWPGFLELKKKRESEKRPWYPLPEGVRGFSSEERAAEDAAVAEVLTRKSS
jgi:hypothetical protein